jgi:hypothetical protein
VKCAHCPLAGSPPACPAVVLPHPPFCWYQDPESPWHDPAKAPLHAARLRGLAEAGTPAVAPPPAPTPPNPHAARLALVHACDYRIPRERGGCGCNARDVCLLRRGPLRSDPTAVTLSDCLACTGRA